MRTTIPASTPRRLLLTPGPLTTSDTTRAALDRDWGSRDDDFVDLTTRLRTRLASLVGGGATHETVLLAGSGTFAVEAALQSLSPPDGRTLLLVNGAYGRRMAEMLRRLGRDHLVREWPENEAVDPDALDRMLADDAGITDVALVHCETTSGLLNPLDRVASVVRRHDRRLLLDAMSSFGVLPIDAAALGLTAVMASSNKGLEGVPGIGFVIAESIHLSRCAGHATSLSLDLHDQAEGFRRNGQWRFTPPVQVAAALDSALDQLEAKGGIPARQARYRRLHAILVQGMAALGFEAYLAPGLQAPVIVTFKDPGPPFDFEMFYAALQAQGIVIYPGKLTRVPSFRIGCIGALDDDDMHRVVATIRAFHPPIPPERSRVPDV